MIYILNNTCRWIIHALSSWLQCIIFTCFWHPLPSHYNTNCILRRPHYFFTGHLQYLSEYHLPKSVEIVYLSLPYLYLYWHKRECPKHPLASRNQKESWIQEIKPIQVTKPCGKYSYDSLKSILITVKSTRSSFDNAVLS